MKHHFLDVGANVGQTFTDFLNLHTEYDGWTVWCFEPSPRHLPALMEAAYHQSDRYEVHVCPFGMRGAYSILPFFQKDDCRGDSFSDDLASDHKTENLKTKYYLHALSVGPGAFIRQHTLPDDEIILKLDCEGSEYWILKSIVDDCIYQRDSILNRISTIYVEWHTIARIHSKSAKELSSFFEQVGKPLQRWLL